MNVILLKESCINVVMMNHDTETLTKTDDCMFGLY